MIQKSPQNLNICSDFHLGRHFFGLVGGFFVGLSVTLPHEVQIIKMLSKMKTMIIRRLAFAMLAAMLSLASCSSRSVCNCDTVQQDSCLQQHRLSFIKKGQKMTRDINPNALKMRKFDPYKKKFNDMQLIKIIGPHIRR